MNKCHQLDSKPHEGSSSHCFSPHVFLGCDTNSLPHKLMEGDCNYMSLMNFFLFSEEDLRVLFL